MDNFLDGASRTLTLTTDSALKEPIPSGEVGYRASKFLGLQRLTTLCRIGINPSCFSGEIDYLAGVLALAKTFGVTSIQGPRKTSNLFRHQVTGKTGLMVALFLRCAKSGAALKMRMHDACARADLY